MQTDYEAMKKAVDDYLAQIGVRYSVVNAGVRQNVWGDNERPTEQDAWRFTLDPIGTYEKPVSKGTQPYSGDYFTGIGHRILPSLANGFPSWKKKDGKPVSAPPHRLAFERRQQEVQAKRVAPRAADIIHCLLLDSSANDMSFHDWASDYGYDTDSIKALNTYNACCETARDLRRTFNHEQLAKLRELTEDL